ncbi:MAG: hypothetical protein KBD53_01095 [Candidatus Omnitrophica bacterium]|nr:hypothetical protein [Candidatus Omnitrophota bacterium]
MLKIFRPLLIISSIILYLGWIYFPALTTHYLHHDDVNYFYITTTQHKPKNYQLSLASGRFIGARIYAAYGLFVKSIADLSFLRISSFIQLIICVLIIYALLIKYLKNPFHALCISALMGTLPGFQVLVTFAAYAFQTTGALLGLTAAYLINRIPDDQNLWKRLIHPFNLLSILCLLAGFGVHPSTPLLYWTGITILFLCHSEHFSFKTVIVKMINPFFTAFCSMTLYAGILKITKKYFTNIDIGAYNPYTIANNYVEKINWFFQEPFLNSLNLWNIFPNHFIANTLLIFILLTAMVYCIYTCVKSPASRRKSIIFKFLFIGIILSAFIFLSFITNLLAVKNAPYYRCCLALTTIILLFFLLSLRQWFMFLPPKFNQILFSGFLFICLILTGINARTNLTNYRVRPSQIELALLMKTLKGVNFFEYQRIYVVQPDQSIIKTRYDEFGTPTSQYTFDIIGFIAAGIRECVKNNYSIYYFNFDYPTSVATFIFSDKNGKRYAFDIIIATGSDDKRVKEAPPTLTIDMTPLYYRNGELAYLRSEN